MAGPVVACAVASGALAFEAASNRICCSHASLAGLVMRDVLRRQTPERFRELDELGQLFSQV